MGPKIDVSKIYPDATADATNVQLNADQQVALAMTRSRAEEASKPISRRAPMLMVFAILGLADTVYSLYLVVRIIGAFLRTAGGQSAFGGVAFSTIILVIDALIYLYLLTSKTKSTVQLVLLILLILQALSVFGFLTHAGTLEGYGLYIAAASLLLLFIAYAQVRSLRDQ